MCQGHLICHSHLLEGSSFGHLCSLIQADLVSTYYNDNWVAQIKKRHCVLDPEGLGRNDERLGLALGKSWNLNGEHCRKGFLGWHQEERQLSSCEAAEVTGVLSVQSLSILIADAGSRFDSTGSCLAGNNT